MRLLILVSTLFLFVALPFDSLAQSSEAQVEPLEVTPSGQAYIESLRFRGIEADVAYYDPTRPAPELETTAEPDRRINREGPDREEINLIEFLIAIGVIVGVGTILYLFGGQMGLSIGSAISNPERDGDGRSMPATAFGADLPQRLQDILAIKDRRAALMALAQYALARVVTANGLRLQRSWTVRDALRRLPGSQSHLAQLRVLVLAAERVHFGGRDVSEDEFNAHVSATRPLLTEREATS